MDRVRVKSRTMPTTLGTNSKSRGSLQKGIHGKHKKHHVTQSKTNTGTSEATSATASLQLSALGLLGPSIVPISPNSWSLVRVYFGNLSPETVYKTVLVSPQTTAKDVVAMVLKSLPCLPKGTVAEDLSLQEMQESSQGSYYRVLGDSEYPLVNQSKWEDPSTWSFRLSWRSKEVEKKQTGMPTCVTPASCLMDAHSTEHTKEAMSTPGDGNPNNDPFGRHRSGTSGLCGHSKGTVISPPQGLSQEQQRQYIEISRTISSLERQVPFAGSNKLQEKGEEEMEEEVVIIDMQEDEGGEKSIYQNLLPLPKEETPQANGQEFSSGKLTQQLSADKRNAQFRHVASPNSNYSNANLSGIAGSHVVKKQKSTIAHKRRLVKSWHMTVNSSLANEPANCPPWSCDSLVTPRQAAVERDVKCARPKSSSDGHHDPSSPPFVARGLQTSVSCPSLQERWQILGVEISAALQLGVSGVMQRVIQEGGSHQATGKLVTQRRCHSMSSYPRKERQQRGYVQHVRELHPVIPEDEVSDESKGEFKQTGAVHGEASAPVVLCERRGKDATSDGSRVEHCLERGTNGVDHKTFVVAREVAGDRLGDTDDEKGKAYNNDNSTSDVTQLDDSAFILSAHEALSSSSCQTPSDLHCSTDEGISFSRPMPCSKSSTTNGNKERLDSKQRMEEAIEFEEELVIVSFLDSDSQSSGSSIGRSSQCTKGEVSGDHHGNTGDSGRPASDGSGVESNCGTHTSDVASEEHDVGASNHSGPTHALNEGNTTKAIVLVAEGEESRMTEVVRINLEDSTVCSTPSHAPRDGGDDSVQSKGASPEGTSANERPTSPRMGMSYERVTTADAIQKGPNNQDTLKTKVELVRFSSPNSSNKLPLSKRDLDVDSDFLLWDGSDTGFIDDDDDFLPSMPITPGSQRSPGLTVSTDTPTGSLDLSLTDSFEPGETLSSETVATIRHTPESVRYWQEEGEEGGIALDGDEYNSNEQEELFSPDDVPLQSLLSPEMERSCWAQESSQLQLGSGSGADLFNLLMGGVASSQLLFSQLYVIREEPLVEEIEEREYATLHQTLWETEEEEEEEENSIRNNQDLTEEDDQSSTEGSLVHWEDDQCSLQFLSDFLQIPCHLLNNAKVPWMSSQMQSVQASVEYTTNVQRRNEDIDDSACEMPERANTDNALEEAMSVELDIDSWPVSPCFQSKDVGNESNVGGEGRPLSCAREHQSDLSVPYCSSTCSDDKYSEEIAQKPPSQGHMYSSTVTPLQSLDTEACSELAMNAKKGGSVQTAESAAQLPAAKYAGQGVLPVAAKLISGDLQPVASLPVTPGHTPFDISCMKNCHTIPATKVARGTHSEV